MRETTKHETYQKASEELAKHTRAIMKPVRTNRKSAPDTLHYLVRTYNRDKKVGA